MINTSPEPFTNWGASIAEDLAVFAGLWAALSHPVLFLIAFVAFVALIVWLLPKIFRGIAAVGRKVGGLFGGKEKRRPPSSDYDASLQRLFDAGVLNETEFQAARARTTA